MRRRIRPLPLLLATFAGLLLVVGLRLALVVGSLQPAELAARLREEARVRTGHDLTVEGLEMDLLPCPTVTLTGLVLGPAPGFGPEPLAQAARVQATFRLLPLLRRRLEVGTMQVDGLRIELERGPTGRGSWETLREHLGGLRGESQEGSRDLPALRIGDANLRYRDLGGGREVEIDGLALRFGRGFGQGTRALAVEGALRSVAPQADGHIAASARMLAPPGALVQLQDLRLDATLATGGRSLTLHAAGPVELDTTRARLSAPALALHLEASGEGLPTAPVAVDLAGLLRADLQDGRLWLEELSVDAAGLRATGALTVAGLPAAPTVDGRLALSSQDLGAALAALGHPLPLVAPAALAQVSATLPFRWAAGALEVDDLDLRLGEARIRGDLTARDLQPPDLRFELDATALDLDGWRPVGEGDGSAWPPAGLATAHVAGRLRGHDLRLGGVTVAYLDLPLELQGGRLQVAKARVTALSGGLNLDLDADLVGVDGRQHLEAELVTLDLARALEALGSERGLSGTAQAHGDLWATGRSADDLRGSLSGELCIALVEGVIPLERGGEDAAKGRPLRAKRAGRAARELSGVAERVVALARERVGGKVPTRLTYHRLDACFDLEGGVASTADLRLDAEELQLRGAGLIDLGAGTIDLNCLVTLGELVPLGMHIHGTLAEPLVEVDKPKRMELVRGLMEQRREQRHDKIQEQRQALRDELRSAGSEGVDTLLDQREDVREKVHGARDAARERRQGVRDKIKEKLGKGEEEEDVTE